MNLQKLYDKVFEKAQEFGELSVSGLSCQDAMEIIRFAQASKQNVLATGICPFCNDTIATEQIHLFCYPIISV